jgi:hypothetical protein
MGAANQDQQRAAVRTALIFVQVLSPSAASCDDRGVLERAQKSLPAMRDVVGSRNIGLCHARSKAAERGRRTAKTHSTNPRTLPALACASLDQFPLELGNAGEHCDQQPAVWRRHRAASCAARVWPFVLTHA